MTESSVEKIQDLVTGETRQKQIVHLKHRRVHESLCNVTPANMYAGWQQAILRRRERINRETLERRRRDSQEYALIAVLRSCVSGLSVTENVVGKCLKKQGNLVIPTGVEPVSPG